jgi:hypothetical protein
VFTPLICFIRITPVFIREEHRAVSDKINQRSYWNTEVILIKQIRGVNTGVIVIKQIRGVNTGVILKKTNQMSEHRGDSDKTNQRSDPCVPITPLICFIRITPVFTPLICFIRITPVFTPLIC